MKVLILGAGATGGYFGGRLLEDAANDRLLGNLRLKSECAERHGEEAPVGDQRLSRRDRAYLVAKIIDVALQRRRIGEGLELPRRRPLEHFPTRKAAKGNERDDHQAASGGVPALKRGLIARMTVKSRPPAAASRAFR